MIWNSIEWFVYGAVFGYFANPIWQIGKRIVQEAKIVRKEWRKPVDRDPQ